ncbi:sensor histidine kinase [Hymenobacter pini]|uniref:sensor histidine kinase n=1 Tax=Hymenobacter pini TaxID=2880879 RepID=UPI001CF4A985|nr:sensor histidine kinase [Hymenobacter pini]MCA8831699.1 sensor histidine kinase [Hymenobacter pini]
MMHLPRPSRSDWFAVAMYWLLATPFVMSSYVHEFGWLRAVAGMAYNIVLDSTAVYVLVFLILPKALSGHQGRQALLLLVLFIAGSILLYGYGYYFTLGQRLPVTVGGWLIGVTIRHAMSYALLAIFITMKRYFEMQKRLLLVQKAQAESELRNLKAQIDPHFLFNNLNVLRGLIQQSPEEANEYLNRFAALYRFLIRHKDEDIVSVAEELRFAEEYIYLLRHRFGNAYLFRQELEPSIEWENLMVVPGTLQLLLENAIKHNAGNEDFSLCITINATATSLGVRHARRPKLTPVESTGTGLANLRERYRLLFERDIVVVNSANQFAVTVPVLPQSRAWSAA